MSTVFIIAIVIAAFVIGFILAHLLQSKTKETLLAADIQLRERNEQLQSARTELEQLRKTHTSQAAALAAANADIAHFEQRLKEQSLEMEAIQKRLTAEFENIANRVLKERSTEFSVASEQKLNAIINPLGEKIVEFKKQVADAYNLEARDKAGLQEAIKGLVEANSRIQKEADNLTKALKGDVKKQGNWGEIVLERVLEASGLTKGIEYEREEVIEGAGGASLRPDVIIHLPDNKHIIVDSKVSLVNYERMVGTNDEAEYAAFLKEHLQSLRNHIKGLAERNYQLAFGVNTPDFVLMFLPIEASFAVALQNDTELFAYAWDRKIVIVSPTTLLATLRTVASIWKQENQTRNAIEIANLSGALYDKLVGFLGDWNKVKENIDRAGRSYDEAMSKMADGRGNLFRTAEKIKILGAKTAKNLPPELID